jgi:hypothetical protein
MDNGCIEIGNINTRTSTEAIGKLKSILDRHAIFHILDGDMFFDPHEKATQKKEINQGRAREVNKTKSNFCRNNMYQSDPEKYRKLIVPDLYELNYLSLIYFDPEEADFLSTLIYGGD